MFVFTHFPSKTKLKLHICLTPKLAKNVTNNLDMSKALVPDCIPEVVLKNFEPQLSHVLADLFHMYLMEPFFSRLFEGLICGPCIRALLQKTTTLLVFFLWFVKSLKNLWIIGLLRNMVFYFQYNFRLYWSTTDLVYLIELLEFLIDLGLVKLQHLIYPRLLTEFGMLAFFTNLSLMEFWLNYWPYLVFSQK